jgi:hypothetical protein
MARALLSLGQAAVIVAGAKSENEVAGLSEKRI